jgi:hypothetical protein
MSEVGPIICPNHLHLWHERFYLVYSALALQRCGGSWTSGITLAVKVRRRLNEEHAT